MNKIILHNAQAYYFLELRALSTKSYLQFCFTKRKMNANKLLSLQINQIPWQSCHHQNLNYYFLFTCVYCINLIKNLCARLRYMKMIVGDLVPHKMQKVGNDIFQKLWCKQRYYQFQGNNYSIYKFRMIYGLELNSFTSFDGISLYNLFQQYSSRFKKSNVIMKTSCNKYFFLIGAFHQYSDIL